MKLTASKLNEAVAEMPKYKCHKTVWALKIAGFDVGLDGNTLIVPEEKGYAQR